MVERRTPQRHRTFKAGVIALHHAGVVSCTVRNLSDAGACLEVVSQMDIPDSFTLVVDVDHLKRPCHVAWRSRNRIGVAFD
jgi:hypothetical protein